MTQDLKDLKEHLEEALSTLRDRAHALIAAIAAHAEARLAYESAMDALEDARARAILGGLEGRNAEARQAELLERTREEEEALRTARAVYRVAEANLEMARTAWALEREAVRVLTLLAGSSGPAPEG
ncbi:MULTISPECIES: hypothetical protein [Thermus]|jgi:hypothetical protein|uniref:hypothetical protein n=1 Tax=Thermus thalpophilus TaxID=2908147 RepID=UPI001FAB0628|nr:hypothetical protein [Thermus thalpophilus]